MSFSIDGFSTIRLSVANIAQSRDWYARFFACEPIENLEDFAAFKIAGVTLEMAVADSKSPFSTGGSVGYWQVGGSLNAAIEHAKQLGAKVYRGPLYVPEIDRTIVQIQDPFGNVIGLEGVS